MLEAWKDEDEELQAAEEEERKLEEGRLPLKLETRQPGLVEWLGRHLADYMDDQQERRAVRRRCAASGAAGHLATLKTRNGLPFSSC